MRGKVAIVVFILNAGIVISRGEFLPQFTVKYYKATNRALLNHVYQAKTTTSAVICGMDCSTDPHCASFNYHESNHLCEMNIVSRSMDICNFVKEAGSAYFDNNNDTLLFAAFLSAEYQSCQMLLQAGHHEDGIYTIYPLGGIDSIQVYCDMTTSGGGWIVIQRRQDGSVEFKRDWTDYQIGFGSLCGEFWLGNEIMRNLTTLGKFMLRVDMEDWEGNTAWAEYGHFEITGEKYALSISSYNVLSTAGDSLAWHNTQQFTTKDQDNDPHPGENCAQSAKGAWWYNSCFSSHLNGEYFNQGIVGFAQGIQWEGWKGYRYSLKKCTMKIKEVF